MPDPAAENELTLANDFTPPALRIAAGWAWRLIQVAALTAGIIWLVQYFSQLTIPVALAVLLTALLTPLNAWLRRRKVNRIASALLCLLVLILVVAGAGTLVGAQIASQASSLGASAIAGLQKLLTWLGSGPLGIDHTTINHWLDELSAYLSSVAGSIASGAASAGIKVGHFVAGAAIAIIATFFFLMEGDKIWAGIRGLLPKPARVRTQAASESGWATLVSYMRAQVIVCLVDATGVLIFALILGVPLPWALFALTFVASFVPILGAFTAGTVAVSLALLAHGWLPALLMLGGVIFVMEMESHFLQPLLLGKAVDIHPLAVLLGIAAGSVVAGLVGALLAIPLVAFLTAFLRSLSLSRPYAQSAEPTPDASG